MKDLGNISIRWKLTLLIVTISTVSLLLASAAFITSDRINTQQTVSNNLATMAEIIAANSSIAQAFIITNSAGKHNLSRRRRCWFTKTQHGWQQQQGKDCADQHAANNHPGKTAIQLGTGTRHQ